MYFTAICLDDERVTGSDLLVWYVLCSFAKWEYRAGKPKQASKIFPSYETIAKRAGLSRRTVAKSIKLLIELGYVELDKSGQEVGRSNSYRLRPEGWPEGWIEKAKAKAEAELEAENQAENEPCKICTPPVQNLHAPVQNLHGGMQNLHSNNTYLTIPITRSFNSGAEIEKNEKEKSEFLNRPYPGSCDRDLSRPIKAKPKRTKDDYMTLNESIAENRRRYREEMARPGAFEELKQAMRAYNSRNEISREDKEILDLSAKRDAALKQLEEHFGNKNPFS